MMAAINFLFLHRMVYKMQTEKIDKAIATVSGMYTTYTKLIVDKIPKYVEVAKK